MTIFKYTILEHLHNHSSLLSSQLIGSWKGHLFDTAPRSIEARKWLPEPFLALKRLHFWPVLSNQVTILFGPKMALKCDFFAPGSQNLQLSRFFYCIIVIYSSRQSFWYVTWHGLTKLDLTGAVLGPKMALMAMFFGLMDLGGVPNEWPHQVLI